MPSDASATARIPATAGETPWRNLGAALHRGAPDAPAIIDLGGETAPRMITYAALDAMADGVARGLRRRGLAAGDKVAIVSANRVEYLASFLGAMRAGMVAVPVNFKLPAPTIEFILRDSGAKFVLCDAARRGLCPPDIEAAQFGDSGTGGFEAFLDPGACTPADVAPGDAAMFLYTSGSTGKPKGVVLSHASHLWVVGLRARGVTPQTQRVLVAAPLYHMNALAVSQAVLAQGNVIVLLPAFTAASYIAAIATHRCTSITSVPTMMAMVLRETDLLSGADLSSVTTIRMGSAPVSDGLMAAIRALFPNAEIANGYGTTEAGPIVFAPHPDGLPTPTLSVGVKHPLVELRLVDGADQDAEEGILQMRCPALMSAYHNLPEVTHRVLTADGFYITGDLFRRDADGFYYFVGRADDMFVCGGENIYPGEVEKMLELHPDITQATVVPVPDEIKGAKPVAFVVPRPGAVLGEAEIKQYALAHAAAYQHPRHVWFLAEMPLAGTNKVDRAALKAQALARITPASA
jgi:acyl-CoA synthetase (AMP-forming)/AMP-acid ligase II